MNPYKPFMRWLGSKVNPVIEYDDGAKLEIRVNNFGGYSFKDIVADELVEIAKIDATEYAVTPEAFDIAVDAEIETTRKNCPMRHEICAVIAAIAEKHGFKLNTDSMMHRGEVPQFVKQFLTVK